MFQKKKVEAVIGYLLGKTMAFTGVMIASSLMVVVLAFLQKFTDIHLIAGETEVLMAIGAWVFVTGLLGLPVIGLLIGIRSAMQG